MPRVLVIPLVPTDPRDLCIPIHDDCFNGTYWIIWLPKYKEAILKEAGKIGR